MSSYLLCYIFVAIQNVVLPQNQVKLQNPRLDKLPQWTRIPRPNRRGDRLKSNISTLLNDLVL